MHVKLLHVQERRVYIGTRNPSGPSRYTRHCHPRTAAHAVRHTPCSACGMSSSEQLWHVTLEPVNPKNRPARYTWVVLPSMNVLHYTPTAHKPSRTLDTRCLDAQCICRTHSSGAGDPPLRRRSALGHTMAQLPEPSLHL